MHPGVILAGGEARRLGGKGKAFVNVSGVPLVWHIINNFKGQVNNLAINSRDKNKFLDFGLPILDDAIKEEGGAGPLAGISSAIKWAKTLDNKINNYVVTVPVDTPFLPLDLVKRMSMELSINNADVIMASSNNNIYPVIALWSLDLDIHLDKALYEGIRKIDLFTNLHNVSIVDWSYSNINPFFNINKQKDIILAEKYINS